MPTTAQWLAIATGCLDMLDCGKMFGKKLTEAERADFRKYYVYAIECAIGAASK